jgi:hypothetical protein
LLDFALLRKSVFNPFRNLGLSVLLVLALGNGFYGFLPLLGKEADLNALFGGVVFLEELLSPGAEFDLLLLWENRKIS